MHHFVLNCKTHPLKFMDKTKNKTKKKLLTGKALERKIELDNELAYIQQKIDLFIEGSHK